MKYFTGAFLAIAILFASVLAPNQAFAQRASLCVNNDDSIISKRRCGNFDSYKPGEIAGSCSSCGQDMSGEWSYTPIDNTNNPGTQRTITFTQSGSIFEGSNDFHTIVGKVEGRWIRLTQTVSGEEGEGFVRLAEGSLFTTEGGFTLGTLAVTGETTGGGGAFILRKTP